MKVLIIAEKPSLREIIKKALYNENWVRHGESYSESENYICTNCFGHMFELYDVEDYLNIERKKWSIDILPFCPTEFKYKIKDDCKEQLEVITKLIGREDVSYIINAGDPDAAGQFLVTYVINYAQKVNRTNKPIKRLWFSVQSEEAIRKDIKKLYDNENFSNYYDEEDARAKCDWLIGINYTRLLTLKSEAKISQGRVLGCIVLYIYERYLAQQNFVPETYFNIGMHLKEYDLDIILKDSIFKAEMQLNGIQVVNELNKSKTFVESIVVEEKEKKPLCLFSLTTLQNKMSSAYKLSNLEVLNTVQKLYEKGFVSYPRTSSEYLGEGEIENVSKIIDIYKKSYSDIEFKKTKHIFDDSKVGSHSAIIPTTKVPEISELSNYEEIVYRVILNRFLSNFCNKKCLIEQTKVRVANSVNDMFGEFKAIRVLEEGFLKFENIIEEKTLPKFLKGQPLQAEYILNECETKPPKNVSETELNNFLEAPFSKNSSDEDMKYKQILNGIEIGTVATRASIIDNAINKYNYITRNKSNGVYKITDIGIYFIETAKKLGLLMSKEQTATLGKYLKAIHYNKITAEQCVKVIEKEVRNKMEKAKEKSIEKLIVEKEIICSCPICGEDVYEGKGAFYCSQYPKKKCNFIINKHDRFLYSRGKSVTKSIIKNLAKNNVSLVKGMVKANGEKYDAYITYEINEQYINLKFADKTLIPKVLIGSCPRCGREIKESEKAFFCVGFKDTKDKCNYIISKNNKVLVQRNIKLTPGMVSKLVEGKKVLVKNVPKKDNSGKYDLYLSLIDTGKYINFNIDYPSKK